MNKNYSLEVTENGYYILENGVKVYHQYEPFIPYRKDTYEQSALAHIEELQKEIEMKENEIPLEERVQNIELMLNELLLGGI